jgi:hypothetical protein
MEIKKYRLSRAWRDVPDDDSFAVGGVEHHLFRGNQLNGRRSRSPALGKVLERTLCHVEQCDEAAINDDRNDKPFQYHLVVRRWLLLMRCPSMVLKYSQHRTKRHEVAGMIARRRVQV